SFSLLAALLVLPSFPTRRSSDLQLPHVIGELRRRLLRPGLFLRRERLRGNSGRRNRKCAASHAVWNALRRPKLPRRFFNGLISRDRKSTRLNSSHVSISYAVFCL